MKIVLFDDQSNTIGETSKTAIKGEVISVNGYDGRFYVSMVIDDVGFAHRIPIGMEEEYLNQIEYVESFVKRRITGNN